MKRLLLIMLALVLSSTSVFAQDKTVVVVPGYYETGGDYGTLNRAIEDAQDDGTINETIFQLNSYEVYVLSRSIFIDHGEHLHIVADKPLRAGDADEETVQESAPPQIVWTEEEIEREYIIQSYGDITMENIWVRYADILGTKIMTGIVFEEQREENKPERGHFDGVIFDYGGIGAESAGTITVKSSNFEGYFVNCHFRNNQDDHFRYYGRAVSFPWQSTDWHYDSLIFENTTFSNIARIVMMEGNLYGDNIQLNHVTILNTVEDVIQAGWLNRMSITNSIIVNPFMIGYRAADICESGQTYNDYLAGECGNSPGSTFSLTPVDSFNFDVDFTDPERQIYLGFNNIHTQDFMKDWYRDCGWCQDQVAQRQDLMLHNPRPYVSAGIRAFMDSTDTEGNKAFPLMNIDDSSMYDEDPDFINPATNQEAMLAFIEAKWDDNSQVAWAFEPEAAEDQVWPLPENMAYNNTTLLSAAMGGYPLGDLNWYPDELESWEQNQRDADWDAIEQWMTTGDGPTASSADREDRLSYTIPSDYSLEQNYPNPFNPTTQIVYSVPESANISLKVYNTIGQEIATLFQGSQNAGNHTVTFDATGLSSGIYFYRLQTADGSVSITRKLMLVR